MPIDALNSIVSLLLSISLAAERLVTILKTFVPWLAIEQTDDKGAVDLKKDKGRRLVVQLIAFVSCWVTSALLVDGGFNLNGVLTIGSGPGTIYIHVAVAGLLASGGSAFWASILGLLKALKDLRTYQAAAEKKKLNT
jgi:hypothetical protein